MDSIGKLLSTSKTIAVVGLSTNESKPSHDVAAYLQRHGFKIVPVNPTIPTGELVLGEKPYPSLESIPASIPVDIVDVFRKPEDIPAVVADFNKMPGRARVKAFWLQLGIKNDAAFASLRASRPELLIFQDACLKIEHAARFA